MTRSSIELDNGRRDTGGNTIDDALLHDEDLTHSEHVDSTFGEAGAYGCKEGPVTVLAACSRAPSWTIPGKSKVPGRKDAAAPGPGSYNVLAAEQAVLRQRPHATISKPKADVAEGRKSDDGPGFDCDLSRINVPKTKGGVVASVGRDFEIEDVKAPGPGAYLGLRSTLSAKGVAAMGEPPCRRRPGSAPPGGRREQPSSAGRARRVEVSRASCGESSVLRTCRAEGSGRAPGCSIPQAKRPDITIGGGAAGDVGAEYLPPSTLKTGGASCRNGNPVPLHSQGAFELRPEPFTYCPSMRAHIPEGSKRSFTRAARPSSAPLQRSDEPGPGSYSAPELPRRGLAKIGDSPARLDCDDGRQPGPGAYTPDASRLRTGGGNETTFAKAPKEVATKPDDVSGASAMMRRARITQEFMAKAAAKSSGQPAVASSTLRSRGPKLPPQRVSGSGAGRGAAAGGRGPGPGAFNVSRNWSSKQGCKFGRASRLLNQQADEGPGPGSYCTELGKSIKGGKLRPQGAGRASSAFASLRSSSTPGPEYKVYSLWQR